MIEITQKGFFAATVYAQFLCKPVMLLFAGQRAVGVSG